MPTISVSPLDVSQGATNQASPSLGVDAVILPSPLGSSVNPNPVSLIELESVWGFRRDTWQRRAAALFGTTAANSSWWQAVDRCALHFEHTGRAFEVLYAGNTVRASLLADGRHATPRFIATTSSGGVAGAALDNYNCYTRYEFGSLATRRISLYTFSTQGPCAIAVGAGDAISAWNRADAPAMAALADSYGGSRGTHWWTAGIFHEAAVRLGIAHVHADARGGTGYARNAVQLDPAMTFGARLPAATATAPDLFVTAGGINDNNRLDDPPYATAQEARDGFEAAVRAYFRDLRTALPGAVLAAIGPWHPNAAFYPQPALDKADTIRAAVSQQSGPWIFIDNLRGGWVNSSRASAPPTGLGWQTGTGTVANPKGDGNGDLYVSADGTHPSEEGCRHLGEQLATALKAAIRAL